MPYLDTIKDGESEEKQIKKISVPNIIGLSIKDAQKILKDSNLQLIINNEQESMEKENIIVNSQIPSQGIEVNEGSKIFIDY